MSYGSEILSELEANSEVFKQNIIDSVKKGVWITSTGQKIHVTDMTDSHIENAIAYLKRNDSTDSCLSWIMRLKKEKERRNTY